MKRVDSHGVVPNTFHSKGLQKQGVGRPFIVSRQAEVRAVDGYRQSHYFSHVNKITKCRVEQGDGETEMGNFSPGCINVMESQQPVLLVPVKGVNLSFSSK